LSFSSALVVAACSSDDGTGGVTTPDGGGTDSSRDNNLPDTGPDLDGNTQDSGSDSGFDAGLKLDTFAETIANELCNTLTRCCFGSASVADGGAVDGGHFNRGRCLDLYSDLGFENSLLGSDALTKGNVTLDQSKGADCLAKLKALSCSLTGAELKTARAACYGALAGKLTATQGCRGSIECAPGNFCLPDSLDGGVGPDAGVIGKCAALRGSGGSCNIRDTTGDCADSNCIYNNSVSDSAEAEEACSYRGGGDTGLRCNSYDPGGDVYRARTDWTCQPTVANDTGCNSTVWCSDGVCDPTAGFQCKSPVTYYTPAACNSFVLP
jgi:hypothetical protein